MGLVSYHNNEYIKKLAMESKDDIFDPEILEESFGIPGWVCQIESLFFDTFTKSEKNSFEIKLLESIPVGINLEPVKYKFISYILTQSIDMLKSPSKTKVLEKAKEGIIPYLEATKDICNNLISSGYEENIINDFDFISRTLKASLPRDLKEEEYKEMFRVYSEKLIELFKKEDNSIFFKFKSLRNENKPFTEVIINENSPLILPNPKSGFNYLKSLIKRIF